jgi:hypothetical protein
MKRMMRAGVVVAALMIASSAVAQQAPDMVSANNPEGVAAAMRYAGYSVKLATDKAGDPKIETEFSGYTGDVYFYGCNEKSHTNCSSLQLVVGFDGKKAMDLAALNKLMGTLRYASSYVDDEGDVWVQYDLRTLGGIPAPVFLKSLDDFSWVSSEIADAVFAGEN